MGQNIEKLGQKVVVIIPARYASTRFPGKPLAKIGGRSMIEWVWRRAGELFEYRFVATDDQRIAKEVESFGGVAIMTSETHPSGTDRVAEALSKLPFVPEVVVNVQGDEPFVRPDQLASLVGLFDDPSCDIATLVQPFSASDDIFNPNAVKVVRDSQGFALYFSRSAIPYFRDLERSEWSKRHTYFRHIGLYGYRYSALNEVVKLPLSTLEKCESLEQLRWVESGYRIKTAITEFRTVGVDTPEELAEAEKILSQGL